MLEGVFIFVDDEYDDPIYADPAKDELPDEELWVAACQALDDAIEGDGPAMGSKKVAEWLVVWRHNAKTGLSFVAVVTDDVNEKHVHSYLQDLTRVYMDEVDDPLNPEREGVEDVVVSVVPAWDEDED